MQANEKVTEGSEVRGQKLVKQFTKMIDSIFLYSKVIFINYLWSFDHLMNQSLDHLIYSIFLDSKVILTNYHCHLWSSWARGRLCDWFSWRIPLLSSQSQTCSDRELAGKKFQKELDVKCNCISILLTFVIKSIGSESRHASKFIFLKQEHERSWH